MREKNEGSEKEKERINEKLSDFFLASGGYRLLKVKNNKQDTSSQFIPDKV